VTARLRSNHRRLFERLDRVPAGYMALGDAICSLNPFYSQGMTVAVQEALALGTALERHGPASVAMVRDYYRAAAEVVTVPWQMAVDGDFAYPQTSGPPPRGVGFRNAFATRLMLASQVVPDLRATFFGVLQLVAPPEELRSRELLCRSCGTGAAPGAGTRSPPSSGGRAADTGSRPSAWPWRRWTGSSAGSTTAGSPRWAKIGLPSLVLTTTGRRTGQSRCQPLLYTLDEDGYVVAATNWGLPATPDGRRTCWQTRTRSSRSGAGGPVDIQQRARESVAISSRGGLRPCADRRSGPGGNHGSRTWRWCRCARSLPDAVCRCRYPTR
jgi:hypothetical protein